MRALRTFLAAACLCAPAIADELALFTRGVMAEVKETDEPRPGERVERIEWIACRGEFEPFALAVRPAKTGWRKVSVSPLRAAEGGEGEIPASAVEVALLRYGRVPGYLGRYSHATDWLVEPVTGDLPLPRGKTARLWLTVRVPDDAAAGRYEGTLTLTGAGGQPVRVPLALEVLPAKLEPAAGVQFALLSTVAFGQYHSEKLRAERKPDALRFYRELRDHGMTCISPKCSDWPYKPGHFEGLEACVAAAKEVGFTGPVLWNMSTLINTRKGGERYKHFDGKCDGWNEPRDLARLRQIIRTVGTRAKAGGWPEIVYYVLDEPGTQTDNLEIRALRMGSLLPKTLKVIDECGARGLSTISEPVDEKHNKRWVKQPDELRDLWDLSRPYCHIRVYAYGYPQGRTNLAFERADCRKRGHEMWFYHNAPVLGRDRYAARLFFGLWGWLVEAQGLTAWTYPGGRTLQFELVREGIDDFRYLDMLGRWAKGAAGSSASAREVRAFLDQLRGRVELDDDGYIRDWRRAAIQATAPGSAAPDFAAFKRRLARLISMTTK